MFCKKIKNTRSRSTRIAIAALLKKLYVPQNTSKFIARNKGNHVIWPLDVTRQPPSSLIASIIIDTIGSCPDSGREHPPPLAECFVFECFCLGDFGDHAITSLCPAKIVKNHFLRHHKLVFIHQISRRWGGFWGWAAMGTKDKPRFGWQDSGTVVTYVRKFYDTDVVVAAARWVVGVDGWGDWAAGRRGRSDVLAHSHLHNNSTVTRRHADFFQLSIDLRKQSRLAMQVKDMWPESSTGMRLIKPKRARACRRTSRQGELGTPISHPDSRPFFFALAEENPHPGN